MKDWHFVPVGVAALAEKFDGRRVPPAQCRAMVDEACSVLLPFEERHGFTEKIAKGQLQLLGTSGTVTTLVGLHKKLPRYGRNMVDVSRLRRNAALDLCKKVSMMSFQKRVASPLYRAAARRFGGCCLCDFRSFDSPLARVKT